MYIQTISVYIDDSGALNRNEPSGWFIYAGFVFRSKIEYDNANRLYRNARNIVKQQTGRTDEIKAFGLSIEHKSKLYKALSNYESFSVSVLNKRIAPHILDDKKSICRYKDYALKRAIKEKLTSMISIGLLDPNEDTSLLIFIDEQLTATNGYYDLESSILEELKYGIVNWNYGKYHTNLFNGKLSVNVKYLDSSKSNLIQASDILANRIHAALCYHFPKLLNIPSHTHLYLP